VQMPSINRTMSMLTKKNEEKAPEERGFVPTRHETLHLLRSTQKHPKRHHGMQSSPHHGCNERCGSMRSNN
jgi:hypothetical protein